MALNVSCLKIMGIFLQNILSRPVWICVSGFSWQQFLGEGGQRCPTVEYFNTILPFSKVTGNEMKLVPVSHRSGLRQQYPVLPCKREAEGDTHHPPFPRYQHFYIALPDEITNIQKNKVYCINESRFIKLQV